jgi:hypothetical protein
MNMKRQDNVLHTGTHIELRRIDGDGFKYEYLHEQRCDGQIVSVLPVHHERGMLIRKELTPCWGEGPFINSLTGGWERDKHATPIDTVVDEMREEAGIVLDCEDAIYTLGTCRGAKSCDSVYHLFLVDLSDDHFEEFTPEPDSILESRETCEWVALPENPRDVLKGTYDWLMTAADPLLYVMFTRWIMSGEYTHASRDDYGDLR